MTPEARSASTVILLQHVPPGARRSPTDDAEVYLLRRHRGSRFMAGAYVFPGGTLDADDNTLASEVAHHDAQARLGEAELGPTDAAAFFIAGIRETFEEAGVFLGEGLPSIEAARAEVLAGRPFADVVRSHGATLRFDWLAPQARWITPVVETRRYDARFFIACVPSTQRAQHDAIETTEGQWMTPASALARCDAGEIQLPPPTLRTLQHLARLGSIDAITAAVASQRPPCIMPVFHAGETPLLALPGDPLHPDPKPALPGPTRMILERGRWWSQPR